MMKLIAKLVVCGGLIILAAMVWPGSVQASGWRQVGWAGSKTSQVIMSLQSNQDMAVVVDGVLNLSHDGGTVWLPAAMPARVNQVVYDPVQSGWLYAGTDTGIYVSHDAGLTWQLLESAQTSHKLVVALTADNQYIFAAMFDGAGTAVQLMRFTRAGTMSILNFPDTNASCLTVDTTRQRLYVGSRSGVFWSDGEGLSWQSGAGAGTFTNHISVSSQGVWQLSPDGLYRSQDAGASWQLLASPSAINNTNYGSSMHTSGLAASGATAYFGDWSIGFPYQFLVRYSGGSASSIFDAKVNDIFIRQQQLWLATDSGVWVNDDGVTSQAAIHRPVIIIPGILGSLPTTKSLAQYATGLVEDGYWDQGYKTPLQLDPILHTYDGLINYLQGQGYQRDHTLFVFPYNWMQSAATTSSQLAQKIRDVRQACGCSQVDLVAHSLGGLVARSYIQSDAYEGDVANLIQLGTPNAGSVADYSAWESGEYGGFGDVGNLLADAFIKVLAGPKLDAAKVVAIHNLMPSIEQLLPVFDYLEGRHYPQNYPRNSFLEGLNLAGNLSRLRQRATLTLIGGNSIPTLSSLVVGAPQAGALVWPDGPIVGEGFVAGDNTVQQSSLEAAGPASLLLAADHHGIVTAAAPYIAQVLNGGAVDNLPAPSPPEVPSKYLLAYAQGNVSMQLAAANGQTISDTALTIPGAYYSGSATTPHWLAIPNPASQPYQLQVTGDGAYTLGVLQFGATSAEPSHQYISGNLSPGLTQAFEYDPQDSSLHTITPAEADTPSAATTPTSVLPTTPVTPIASSITGAVQGPASHLVNATTFGQNPAPPPIQTYAQLPYLLHPGHGLHHLTHAAAIQLYRAYMVIIAAILFVVVLLILLL